MVQRLSMKPNEKRHELREFIEFGRLRARLSCESTMWKGLRS